MALGLAIGFAVAFSLTNGFHDAANAIATLIATRGAPPGQAIVLSAVPHHHADRPPARSSQSATPQTIAAATSRRMPSWNMQGALA
jgi:hypothetical protein